MTASSTSVVAKRLQDLGKVVTGSDLLRVEKDVGLLELALQPVAQAAGVCARIIAPIADENPGHALPPAGSNESLLLA
jgi:hypothetical protein